MEFYRFNEGINVITSKAKRKIIYDSVFLCAPGPGLKEVASQLNSNPQLHVACINTAYPTVRPTAFWIGMDHPYCYDQNLLYEPFLKYFGDLYQDDKFFENKLKDFNNVMFLTGTPGNIEEIYARREWNSQILWNGNTFESALHQCVLMGYKTIYLCGVNFGGAYCHNLKLTDKLSRYNQSLYDKQVTALKRLYQNQEGIEFISVTKDSPINSFLKYITIEEAMINSKPKLRDNYKIIHSAQAELCRWCKTPMEINGFVTAADKNQEFMLDWFWANFIKFHDPEKTPMLFIDLGLSKERRVWCEERGVVHQNVYETQLSKAHWKPICLTASPWAKSIWIDLDCEILGNIESYFNYIDNNVVVTLDPYNPWAVKFKNPPIAAGLIGYQHASSIISEWAQTLISRPAEYRDDQFCLNELYTKRQQDFYIAPSRFQRLRLEEEGIRDDALIIHWTGSEGKQIIKSKLNIEDLPVEGKVSILMPMYNVEKYIRSAIDSVLSQTYENWELIIVDDGSVDKSLQMTNKYDDNRIKIIASENGGYVQAVNKCLALVSQDSKYIARLDSDDTYEPTFLEQSLRSIQLTGAHICQTGSNHMNLEGVVYEKCNTGPMNPEEYIKGNCIGSPANASTVALKEVYDKIGGFELQNQSADATWNLKCIYEGCKYVYNELNLYNYRRNPQGMSGTQKLVDWQGEKVPEQLANFADACIRIGAKYGKVSPANN